MIAVAAATGGIIHAWAQVIGDPLGLVQVGTSGENTDAYLLSVSNGGTASSSSVTEVCYEFFCGYVALPGVVATTSGNAQGAGLTAIALSESGCATGALVNATISGCAGNGSGLAAASLEGAADGNFAAVSGESCAQGTGVFAASGTGCSKSAGVAASGTNSASSGSLTASGTGSATSSAPLSTSESGTGGASAGVLAVSGTGPAYACGGPLTVAISAAPLVGGPQPSSCPDALPPVTSVHDSVLSAG